MRKDLSDYKAKVFEGLKALAMAERELFTAMVNIGFSGVYDDISKLHSVGEVLDLELAMFEDTDDANLNLYSSMVRKMMETKLRLMNLNNLSEEDLGLD